MPDQLESWLHLVYLCITGGHTVLLLSISIVSPGRRKQKQVHFLSQKFINFPSVFLSAVTPWEVHKDNLYHRFTWVLKRNFHSVLLLVVPVLQVQDPHHFHHLCINAGVSKTVLPSQIRETWYGPGALKKTKKHSTSKWFTSSERQLSQTPVREDNTGTSLWRFIQCRATEELKQTDVSRSVSSIPLSR